jgi:hypothetical protein
MTMDGPTDFEQLFKLYDVVREYDVHYSTVRSAISTFLITAVFGMDAWIIATTGDRQLMWIEHRVILPSILGPLILLGITMLLSAHFQRLTICCERIQERLELDLIRLHEGKPIDRAWSPDSIVLFRHGLKKLMKGTSSQKPAVRFLPFWADWPQRCLSGFAIAQLVGTVWYWWPVLGFGLLRN